MAGQDLYAALGLTADATSQQIRTAYRNLIMQAEAGQLPPEQRQAIDAAYETLGDPIRRLRYDAQLSAPPPPRIQMPAIGLPNRRVKVSFPAFTRPALPQIQPLPAIAVIVVAAVAILVLLTPVFRHSNKPSAAPQSVSDLVKTATASAAAEVAAGASATSGAGAPRFLTPTTSAARGATTNAPAIAGIQIATPGTFIPSSAATPAAGEPPFLSVQLLTDAVRAVIAAAAVRNGPSQGTIQPGTVAGTGTSPGAGVAVSVPITSPPAAAAVANSAAAASASSAGVPITSPLPSAAQPAAPVSAAATGGSTAATSSTVPLSAANPPTPVRTPLPAPAELSQPVPSGPQPGVGAIVRSAEASSTGGSGSGAGSAAAAGPNRITVPTPAGASGGRTTISTGSASPPVAGAPNHFSIPATPVR
jgi:hypothetical protein